MTIDPFGDPVATADPFGDAGADPFGDPSEPAGGRIAYNEEPGPSRQEAQSMQREPDRAVAPAREPGSTYFEAPVAPPAPMGTNLNAPGMGAVSPPAPEFRHLSVGVSGTMDQEAEGPPAPLGPPDPMKGAAMVAAAVARPARGVVQLAARMPGTGLSSKAPAPGESVLQPYTLKDRITAPFRRLRAMTAEPSEPEQRAAEALARDGEFLRRSGKPWLAAGHDLAAGVFDLSAGWLTAMGTMQGFSPMALPGKVDPALAWWKAWASRAAKEVPHVARIFAFRYVTTPGTHEERLSAANTAALYRATPIWSMGVPNDFLAFTADVLSNQAISFAKMPVYSRLVERAKALARQENKGDASAWKKYLFAAATPGDLAEVALDVTSNVFFAKNTRSATADRMRRWAVDYDRVMDQAAASLRSQGVNVDKLALTISERRLGPEGLLNLANDPDAARQIAEIQKEVASGARQGVGKLPAEIGIRQARQESEEELAARRQDAAAGMTAGRDAAQAQLDQGRAGLRPSMGAQRAQVLDWKPIGARLGEILKDVKIQARPGVQPEQTGAPASPAPTLKSETPAAPTTPPTPPPAPVQPVPGIGKPPGGPVQPLEGKAQAAPAAGRTSGPAGATGEPSPSPKGEPTAPVEDVEKIISRVDVKKGRTVLMRFSQNGKPYTKPFQATIVQPVDDQTVRVRWTPPGRSDPIVEDVSINRLQERASVVGMRRRGQRLAQLKPAKAPGADLARASAEASRQGAVGLPTQQSFNRMRAGLLKLRALFDPNRGVPKVVKQAYENMVGAVEAARLSGLADEQRIQAGIKDLQRRHGRDAVMDAARQVEDGAITLAQMQQRFQIASTHPLIQALKMADQMNLARAEMISKWPGLSEELAQTIKGNLHYQSRRYLRYIMGADYEPSPQAYHDAMIDVEDGLQQAIRKMARKGTYLHRKHNVDAIGYLQSGDYTLLSGLPPERVATAEYMRSQYLKLRQLINGLALSGDKVTAAINADAMRRAATGIVDYYLGREVSGVGARGGLDITSFSHKFLEGAFRELYGEVTDPASRQRLTAETQSKLLAQMTFFNRVLKESEGTAWAQLPDTARNITVRLGDKNNYADRKRYGDLAGKYVTPQMHDLIVGERHQGAVYRFMQKMWFTPMSFQRVGKLLTPKTIARNYITSVTGFALGSGDLLLPTYAKHFARAHGIIKDYASGKAGATEELAKLAGQQVFFPGQVSATYDVDVALGGVNKKLRSMGRKVTSAYAFIDFPAKYAAYMARIDSGMTPEQAAQHVQRMYQNRERVPGIVHKISSFGLADYVGYTYDSVRIRAHQLRWAVESAGKGDIRPLAGFAASSALWIAAAQGGTTFLTEGFAKMHEYMRRKVKDEEEKGITPADDSQMAALRRFLPDYDRNQPLMVWWERNVVGGDTLRYTVAGGNTAWPVEDMAIGLLQQRAHGQSWLQAASKSIGSIVDGGMYVEAWKKMLTGENLRGGGTPTRKGLFDLIGKEDPRTSQIIIDALLGFAADMTVSSVSSPLKQLYEMEQRELAGQESNIGMYANTRTKQDALAGMLRLVRTYRVERSDLNRMIRNAAMNYADAIKTSKAMMNKASENALVLGAATKDQEEAADAGRRARIDYLHDLRGVLAAAKALAPNWYDDLSLDIILKDAGVSADDSMAVISGQDIPYTGLPDFNMSSVMTMPTNSPARVDPFGDPGLPR